MGCVESLLFWREGRQGKGLALLPRLPGLRVVRQGPGHRQLSPHPCSVRGSSPSLPLPVPGVSAVSPSGPGGPYSPAPALHRSESAQRGGSLTGRQRRQLSTQGDAQQQFQQPASWWEGARTGNYYLVKGQLFLQPLSSLHPAVLFRDQQGDGWSLRTWVKTWTMRAKASAW